MSTPVSFFWTPRHYLRAENKKTGTTHVELPVLYRLFPLRKSPPSGNSRGFRALFIPGDQMSVVMQSSCFKPTDLCPVKRLYPCYRWSFKVLDSVADIVSIILPRKPKR